jgi:hypothetical protein
MTIRLFIITVFLLFVFTLGFAWKVVRLATENRRYRG